MTTLFADEKHQGARAKEPGTRVFSPPPAAARPGAVLAAGLFDFLALFAVLTIALVGIVMMGVGVGSRLGPPMVLFVGVFSFVYYVLPLAFWSRTPGMSWAGIVARNEGDQPLTFGQTALRWFGAVLTATLLGLPLLLALSGRSLSDRISGSRSFSSAP